MLLVQTRTQEAIVARDRSAQMRMVGTALDSAFDQAAKFSLALAETGARSVGVSAALSNADRDTLKRLSQGIYDYLARQAGVQIYGYHGKDLRYFLRMHRPDLSGDDISAFRAMVVAANRSQRPQTGVEIGVAGIGIRGVAVVRHEGEIVGTMEAGLDIRPILDLVKASTNAELAVLVAPAMTGVALDPKWPVIGDFALAATTDDETFVKLLRQNRLKPVRDIQVTEIELDGRPARLISRPLIDFAGRHIGMTLGLRMEENSDLRRFATEIVVIALCGGIVAFIGFAVLFRLARRREEMP